MALAWKAGWVNSPQGFESPILRHPDGVDDSLVGAVCLSGLVLDLRRSRLLRWTRGGAHCRPCFSSLHCRAAVAERTHDPTFAPSTNVSGSASSPTIRSTDPSGDPSLHDEVDEAREILSRDEGHPRDAITVVSAESVEWPNSAYGCPSHESSYAPGPFAGDRIVLEANGQDVRQHRSPGHRSTSLPVPGLSSAVRPSIRRLALSDKPQTQPRFSQ